MVVSCAYWVLSKSRVKFYNPSVHSVCNTNMTAFNLSISERKLTKFNAALEGDSIEVKGEYSFTITNDGFLPANNVKVTVQKVSDMQSGTVLVSDRENTVGRIPPMSSTTTSFSFDIKVPESEFMTVARNSCNSNSINLSTQAKMQGYLFVTNASSTGSYNIDSTNCDLEQIEQPPTQQPVLTPEPQPDEPEDTGEREGGNGDNDSESGEQPEQPDNTDEDQRISGPNTLFVDNTGTYEWSDFAQESRNFRWYLLSEREDPDESNTTLELSDNQQQDRIRLDFTSRVEGDFLIVIRAFDSNNNQVDEAQKVVTVMPSGAEQPQTSIPSMTEALSRQ